MSQELNFTFDGPANQKPRLIAVKDKHGRRSVDAGAWIDNKDRTWSLHVHGELVGPPPIAKAASEAELKRLDDVINESVD